jgi:hypothetical protein
VVVALITRKVGDNYLSSKKDESPRLANCDPSLELSQDKLGSYSDSCSDKLNNNPELDEDDGRLSPAKRKRLSLQYPTTAQCKRNASTILSRGLPTNIGHTLNSIGTI